MMEQQQMKQPRSKRPTLRSLQLELERVQARLAELARRETAIEETVKLTIPKTSRRRGDTAPAGPVAMAKGSAQRIPVIRPQTADTTFPDHEVVTEAPLAARIEAILRRRIATYSELVDDLGEPEQRVHAAFMAMRRRGTVYMVGTEERPAWTWVPGDSVTTEELRTHIERIVTNRPTTFNELMGATGANPNRIKHALTTLQKRENPVRNLGTQSRAIWCLPQVGATMSTHGQGRKTPRKH